MGFTTQLAEGLAQYIAAAGAGVWHPDTPYAATDTAITMKALPQAPDRAIAITAYSNDDDPRLPLGAVAVQFRFRGVRPNDPDDDADVVFDALHAADHLVLNGVRVVQAFRRSSAQLGQDDTGRWERTDNYYLTVQQPTTHRPME